MRRMNRLSDLISEKHVDRINSNKKATPDHCDDKLYRGKSGPGRNGGPTALIPLPVLVAGAGDPESRDARQLDALVRAQAEIMDVILQGASLEQALTNIVLAANRILEPALCAIHLADPDGRWLRLSPGPGLGAEIARSAEPIEIAPDRGAIAAAAHLRQPVTVADLEHERMCSGLRRFARRHGFNSCEVRPVLSRRDGLLGTLSLYYEEAPAPSRDRDRVIAFLLSLAGFAMEIEQRQREQRSADERFASLAKTIPGVLYQRLVTPDGQIRYTYISDGAKDLFGVAPEEILADPHALFACHGPEYRTTFRERLLKASRKLEMWDVEAQIITRDGEEKWTHAIARPRRHASRTALCCGTA